MSKPHYPSIILEIFNKRLIWLVNMWTSTHSKEQKWPTSTLISGPRKENNIPARPCYEQLFPSANTALLFLVDLKAFMAWLWPQAQKQTSLPLTIPEDIYHSVSPLPSLPSVPPCLFWHLRGWTGHCRTSNAQIYSAHPSQPLCSPEHTSA